MARTNSKSTNAWSPNPRKKRTGVHSKCKSSKIKRSKKYKKPYRGQGRP
jgi:hypothetical protein